MQFFSHTSSQWHSLIYNHFNCSESFFYSSTNGQSMDSFIFHCIFSFIQQFNLLRHDACFYTFQIIMHLKLKAFSFMWTLFQEPHSFWTLVPQITNLIVAYGTVMFVTHISFFCLLSHSMFECIISNSKQIPILLKTSNLRKNHFTIDILQCTTRLCSASWCI